MTFTFDQETWFKVTTSCPKHSYRIGHKRKNIGSGQGFFTELEIGITLTFDPKTLFKVTANPLPISPLLVKCDSDWTEGREYIFQTNILQIGLEWPLSLTQKLSLNSLQPLYPIALYMYVVADEEWSILYIIYMQVCIFIYLYLLLQTSISHTSICPFTPEILVQGHINPLP